MSFISSSYHKGKKQTKIVIKLGSPKDNLPPPVSPTHTPWEKPLSNGEEPLKRKGPHHHESWTSVPHHWDKNVCPPRCPTPGWQPESPEPLCPWHLFPSSCKYYLRVCSLAPVPELLLQSSLLPVSTPPRLLAPNSRQSTSKQEWVRKAGALIL